MGMHRNTLTSQQKATLRRKITEIVQRTNRPSFDALSNNDLVSRLQGDIGFTINAKNVATQRKAIVGSLAVA